LANFGWRNGEDLDGATFLSVVRHRLADAARDMAFDRARIGELAEECKSGASNAIFLIPRDCRLWSFSLPDDIGASKAALTEAAAQKARAFTAVAGLDQGRAMIAHPTLDDIGSRAGRYGWSRESRFQRRAVSGAKFHSQFSSMIRGTLQLSDAVQTTETHGKSGGGLVGQSQQAAYSCSG
jgi:hypothetical protein